MSTSSSPGHPRASVTSLLYANGHVAHNAPRAVYRSRETVGLLSTLLMQGRWQVLALQQAECDNYLRLFR